MLRAGARGRFRHGLHDGAAAAAGMKTAQPAAASGPYRQEITWTTTDSSLFPSIQIVHSGAICLRDWELAQDDGEQNPPTRRGVGGCPHVE